MKKMLHKLIWLVLILLGSIGSMALASDKTDKLEERNPVLKFGYKFVDDNAENTQSYTGYVRLKKDQVIYGKTYMFIPEVMYRYEERDDDKVNDKHLFSLLVETDDYSNYTGVYSKISTDKDLANNIDSRYKYGLGLYQYLVKSDKFLFKLREGLQYTVTDYSVKSELENTAVYIKLSSILGYYYNENVFLKTVVDYDVDVTHNDNILQLTLGSELKIADKLSLEIAFNYEHKDATFNNLSNDQKELLTSLVYQF